VTDSDLQTCRDWCRANGVSVELVDDGVKGDVMYHIQGRQRWMGNEFDFWCQTEQEVYAVLWRRLSPWLASVRNLDAMEVEGPWKVSQDEWRSTWHVEDADQCVSCKHEQTARTIANLLNRECGDGK